MDRATKEKTVAFLHKELKEAKSLILVDYKGVDVNTTNAFRAQCTDKHVCFRVIKNSLLRRAVAETDYQVLADKFTGPTSVLYSKEDAVEPSKVLFGFDKKLEHYQIKIGALDGKLLETEDCAALAKLPAKEVLLAQTLGVFNGATRSFASVLNQTVASFVHVLQNLKNKKEKES